jgi:hypothetical protein
MAELCVLAWHAPGVRRVLRSLMRTQRERGNAVSIAPSYEQGLRFVSYPQSAEELCSTKTIQ